MVVALELNSQVAAGRPTSQPQGAHSRLGPRVDEADPLAAGVALQNPLSQFRLEFGRRAEAGPRDECTRYRLEDHRVGMPQDHRSPRTDSVDQAIAVHIPEVAAPRTGDEPRCAPNTAEGPHGRVDTPRNERERPFEECNGSVGGDGSH